MEEEDLKKEIEKLKEDIIYKIINRKQKFKTNPFKYSAEDIQEAINLSFIAGQNSHIHCTESCKLCDRMRNAGRKEQKDKDLEMIDEVRKQQEDNFLFMNKDKKQSFWIESFAQELTQKIKGDEE